MENGYVHCTASALWAVVDADHCDGAVHIDVDIIVVLSILLVVVTK